MRVPLFPTSRTPIPIEVTSLPARSGGRTPEKGGRSASRYGTRQSGLPFSALSGQPNRFGFSTGEAAASAVTEGFGEGDGKGDAGFVRSARLIGAQSRLYEVIEYGLDYPAEFIAKDIEGVVNTELVFSADGRWLEGASRVKSTNRFLRVYVHRLLRRALAKGLLTNQPKGYSVRAVFQFELAMRLPINQAEQAMQLARAGTGSSGTGPVLHFQRTHYAWLPIELSATGRSTPSLDGRRPPGAIQPAVGVNLIPLFEKGVSAIGNLFSDKAELDPLDRYRHDPLFTQE